MFQLNLAVVALTGMVSISALAQTPPMVDPVTGARPGHSPGVGESQPFSDKSSNSVPGNTRSNIAPTLPGPMVEDNAASREFLMAARSALMAGRTGQAQQSLEMAETRSLDRSVPQGQTNIPSDSPRVAQIRDARRALGSGDMAQALQLIDLALSN